MKNIIIFTFLFSLTNTYTFASTKECIGPSNVILYLELEPELITIKTIKGDGYNGIYKSLNTTIKGNEDETYLKFQDEKYDHQDIALVDQNLFYQNTTGNVYIKARGIGFFTSTFICKDIL